MRLDQRRANRFGATARAAKNTVSRVLQHLPAPARRGAAALRRAPHLIETFGASSLVLVCNLLTGMIVARSLGAVGRGELTSMTTATQWIAWLFAMGCMQAVPFHLARHPEDGGRLLSTWLLLLLPLGVLGVLFAEAVIGLLFSAQSASTVSLARIYLVGIMLSPLSDLLTGALLGDHDFTYFNALRLLQPLGILAGYVLLWRLNLISVRAALIVLFFSATATMAISAQRVYARHGLGRPSRALARQNFWFGLRAHGQTVGGLVSTRLDLLILPSFLAASSVGLYAVATSVSWIVYSLTAPMALIVLPVAARNPGRGSGAVLHSLYATLAVGTVLAALLALFAPLEVHIIYGGQFADSVLPLRLLLPGSVFYAGAAVLCSGIHANNSPGMATATQFIGFAVTVVGLLVFLRSGGIVAAALVSTLAYFCTFATAYVVYKCTYAGNSHETRLAIADI